MLDLVKLPENRYYGSDSENKPVEFFSDCFLNSIQLDLLLGYFSSSAIHVLSEGFADFIYRGGKMRMVLNSQISGVDKYIFLKGLNGNDASEFDLENIDALKKTLSVYDKHFFECLAYLITHDRIEFKVIEMLQGIPHLKQGVFKDVEGNMIGFHGSCNFTKNAFVSNMEQLTAVVPSDGKVLKSQADTLMNNFEFLFQGHSTKVRYLTTKDISKLVISNFESKSIEELLEQEIVLAEQKEKEKLTAAEKRSLSKVKEALIRDKKEEEMQRLRRAESILQEKKEKGEPCFPYAMGPRDYQTAAYHNWIKNDFQGVFAMATGTGKTLTALNCLLKMYQKEGSYKAIIVVPTITLVEQWETECKKFNFNNIIKLYSKAKQSNEDLDYLITKENIFRDNKLSYIIITTYASFSKDKNFNRLNKLSKKQLVFIADEAHNLGSGQLVKKLKTVVFSRRIGLSATPNRQYDEAGNKLISQFFCVDKEYTYTYSMQEAINKGVLCKYYYYPHLVLLTDHEMQEYKELSTKIAKFFSFSDGVLMKGNPILTALLLKRKRIIHKAVNKKAVFKEIVQKRYKKQDNLKYTLVYVPEGNSNDFEEDDWFESKELVNSDLESSHLIDQYTQIICDLDPYLTVSQFTSKSSDRDEMLQKFASGSIQVLTSMKCLDEGIDVPRSEMAIFCASTGNPRQFIQRRGRILRMHKDKRFAIIHDLIVAPQINDSSSFALEQALLRGELLRVKDFASLSINPSDTDIELHNIMNYYKINRFNN